MASVGWLDVVNDKASPVLSEVFGGRNGIVFVKPFDVAGHDLGQAAYFEFDADGVPDTSGNEMIFLNRKHGWVCCTEKKNNANCFITQCTFNGLFEC